MVKTLPNILSVLRIILAPIFLVMYLQPEIVWRSLSIALFATAAVTDFFDGYIARTYHAESSSGIFLDPLADKLLTISGFICLPFLSPNIFSWIPVGLIIIRDIGTTALRLWADYHNRQMKTRYSAKVKTMIQMLFLYVVLLMGVFSMSDIQFGKVCLDALQSPVMTWLLWAVALLTVYTGVEYIVVNRFFFGNNSAWKQSKGS